MKLVMLTSFWLASRFTLTDSIPFEQVLKAIKEYAFKTSEYPVIISLENHCCAQQQVCLFRFN